MKSNMCLYVEFLAGTSVEDAVGEAICKCRDLNLAYVKFNLNGVNVSIKQNSGPDSVEKIMKAQADGNKYCIC